ncbi:hypothetical protein E2562_008101 [Oryza meyeriana var. granulata]|uniref:F-box domain-containing protein n=1 Tax=Oryza meyeriana var. granulata TaxID=110450 RepID=A0A6G1CEC9_9ORYZ|nr:hypothetical protein E2562_008101 [Oryza meyeriana var. granulata]
MPTLVAAGRTGAAECAHHPQSSLRPHPQLDSIFQAEARCARAMESMGSPEGLMRAVLTCLPFPAFSTSHGSLSAAPGLGGDEDRVSRLPDALLSNIVSHLPVRDAARTAVLSTRWRRLWATTPLVLDDVDLLDISKEDLRRGHSDRVDWPAVASRVSRVLTSHPGPFLCVHLTCCDMATHWPVLSYWLSLLAARGVEDLVFANRPNPFDLPLPVDVLRIPSLRRLYLGFWTFPGTAAVPRGPHVFPHLRELGLCFTNIETQDLDHVLQCSPILETLALVASFYSPAHIRVRSRTLRCVLFWMSVAREIALVVAPRLERLILWKTFLGFPGELFCRTRVKIGYATELRVLGYLDPRVHELEIGNTTIEAGTRMSAGKTVPSVKILALKVRFGIRKEAKMLPVFLRCFPHVETLHVMSDEAHDPTGKLNLKFWQDVGPIECLHSHVNKVVFNKFRGERSELAFLKFILERAAALQKIVVVLADGDQAWVDEIRTKLRPLATAKRASENPTLLIVVLEDPVSSTASLSAAFTSSSCSDGDGEEDRISALPDDLLRHIVSSLPTKDAARTTALSSRWRGIWRSTPLVLIDGDLFPQGPNISGSAGAGASPSIWTSLADAVTRVLSSHPGPFRFVGLVNNFMDIHGHALADWLRLLAAKGVEDLVFVNRPWPLDVGLPDTILRCASLRRLYLGVCRFPDTTGHPRGPDVFPHLQELGICHSIMKDRDLEHVLACCPALETFALVAGYGTPSRVRIESHSLRCVLLWLSMFEELAVVDAPCLERLILWGTHAGEEGVIKIKIGYAPQLTVLGYLDMGIHALQIGNTVIKAGVTNVNPMARVPSVKILGIKVNFEVCKEMEILPSFLKCFPDVEALHIKNGDVDESSGELNSKFWQELGPIECVQSRIKKVVFDQFRGGTNELEFIKFILERAQMLEKIVFVVDAENLTLVDQAASTLKSLASTNFASASEECALMMVGRRGGRPVFSYRRAPDLSLSDPFFVSKEI